ncbi:hypothetical protein L3Q82_004913 [Scortum barcoo]|uniref:Uncharacterized protein n=1 Tax=Scortum barcoo TaxID=214431 RepID=A0ACB8VEL3_9TELE|nr:hypothetical protein L3Q82_004913 [Scortum barcoo]
MSAMLLIYREARSLREELGVEPLLLHIERSQLRWFGHLFRIPPEHLPREACPTWRRPPGEHPGQAGETIGPLALSTSTYSARLDSTCLEPVSSLIHTGGTPGSLRTKGRAGIRHHPPHPGGLRRRPRGCKAGAKLKAELAENRRRYKPSIPSVIMGNVNSLPNKIDELSALNNQRIYRESSLFIFTETWLNHLVPDANVDLLGFTAVVDCPTRNNRTIDLLYVNVRDAYRSTPLPPLGKSDHNLVHLQPLYTPLVQKQPVTTRSVRRWSPEKESALRDCFNTTVWDVLMNPHGEDIEGMTHCLTDYLNFCADVVSPVKTVRCYPNNKPWVTREVKTVLNKKKAAFRSRDREAMKAAQQEGETLCEGSQGQLQEKGGAEAEGTTT